MFHPPAFSFSQPDAWNWTWLINMSPVKQLTATFTTNCISWLQRPPVQASPKSNQPTHMHTHTHIQLCQRMTNTLRRYLLLSLFLPFSSSSLILFPYHPSLPPSLPPLSEALNVFDLKPLLCLYTVSSQGLPDPCLQNACWQSVIHQTRHSLCTSINNWAVLKMPRCRVSLSWGDFIPRFRLNGTFSPWER